jgi:hypothetical protein
VQARLAPLTLLAGLAAGVATVAVYQWVLGLVLAVVTVLLLLVLAPAGWGTRLPYGVGYAGSMGLMSVPRGSGSYLVTASVSGYGVLALALLVLSVSIATLPRPGK